MRNLRRVTTSPTSKEVIRPFAFGRASKINQIENSGTLALGRVAAQIRPYSGRKTRDRFSNRGLVVRSGHKMLPRYAFATAGPDREKAAPPAKDSSLKIFLRKRMLL